MENKEFIETELSSSFSKIESYIESVHEKDFHKERGGKWTIAQELSHLIVSNNGTAFLMGQPEDKFRIADFEGRDYKTICTQYEEKLNANKGFSSASSAPMAGLENQKKEDLQKQWLQSSLSLKKVISQWEDEKLDQYSVWKHPLLGPFTGRDFALFTICHINHHLLSLQSKNSVH